MVLASCTSGTAKRELDVQGHRGCRGLLPENSIAGFIKALDLGVTTLEMDLVVSGDKQVIVSHEPFFSHEISTAPDGQPIDKAGELDHNIYRLSVDEISAYDAGLKPHPRFPNQRKMAVSKPRFAQVVRAAEKHATVTNRPLPWYNIEIKRRPQWDGVYHPGPEEFAQLVLEVVRALDISTRVFIQSFDPASLRICHRLAPEIPLVLLVENDLGLEANLETLGFTPAVYSPAFGLVDSSLIKNCHDRNMQLIPWTVNETGQMQRLIDLGVDGIITDYPDRLIELVEKDRTIIVKN